MIRDVFGRGWLLYVFARIQKKARLSAIKGCIISPKAKIEAGSQVIDSFFDKYSFCGYDCVILNAHIGKFCSIADRVYIGGSNHPIHFVSTSPVFLSHRDSVKNKFSRHQYYCIKKTFIGNDVWIGYDSKIKAGVNVGHGAVIGMGSVVTRDVPPYAIVAGNPAKILKMRFEKEVIDALLEIKWWDYSDDNLYKSAELFNDPLKMLKKEGLL